MLYRCFSELFLPNPNPLDWEDTTKYSKQLDIFRLCCWVLVQIHQQRFSGWDWTPQTADNCDDCEGGGLLSLSVFYPHPKTRQTEDGLTYDFRYFGGYEMNIHNITARIGCSLPGPRQGPTPNFPRLDLSLPQDVGHQGYQADSLAVEHFGLGSCAERVWLGAPA